MDYTYHNGRRLHYFSGGCDCGCGYKDADPNKYVYVQKGEAIMSLRLQCFLDMMVRKEI